MWGITTIINGILEVTTYASVPLQLTENKYDGLQGQLNALRIQLTADEGPRTRLQNWTQNIGSSTKVTSTNLNGKIMMNTGEFYVQYDRIDPIIFTSTPNIVVYLTYRNSCQLNDGVSVNGPVTINWNNSIVNISDTGECTIYSKNKNLFQMVDK